MPCVSLPMVKPPLVPKYPPTPPANGKGDIPHRPGPCAGPGNSAATQIIDEPLEHIVPAGSWPALVVEEPQSALVELGGGDPFDHRLPQVVKAPEPPRPTVVAIGEALLIGKAR